MFKNRIPLVLGLVSLLLVAMSVSRPAAKAPAKVEVSGHPRPVLPSAAELAIRRGRQADSARLTALAEHYQSLTASKTEPLRGREADSARWTAIAKHYQNAGLVQRGRVADALRWAAIAKFYTQLISAGP